MLERTVLIRYLIQADKSPNRLEEINQGKNLVVNPFKENVLTICSKVLNSGIFKPHRKKYTRVVLI